MNWLKENIDGRLAVLVFLFILTLADVTWLTIQKAEEGDRDWARGTATLILGWLGGVITGSRNEKG